MHVTNGLIPYMVRQLLRKLIWLLVRNKPKVG